MWACMCDPPALPPKCQDDRYTLSRSLSMCVCVFVCIHVCAYGEDVYAGGNVYVCVYMYVCMYEYMNECMCMGH